MTAEPPLRQRVQRLRRVDSRFAVSAGALAASAIVVGTVVVVSARDAADPAARRVIGAATVLVAVAFVVIARAAWRQWLRHVELACPACGREMDLAAKAQLIRTGNCRYCLTVLVDDDEPRTGDGSPAAGGSEDREKR